MLRAEARPFDWPSLNDAQQGAVNRLLALMAAAARSLLPPGRSESPRAVGGAFQLDEDRSSRIALLSGDRGTGKTSVLLSLKKLCEPGPQLKLEDCPRLSMTDLYELRDRVIWLEPIDMEPLAESTNLLAAILARIEDAAPHGPTSAGDDTGGRRAYAGLLEPAAGYHETLIDLQRLSADVALAWEGNLVGRGAHLDPDNYAIEVMRAEAARLSLSRRLRKVLEAVAEKAFTPRSHRQPAGPLFVLPVDDFDLNPLRCLDLLRLLRMISIPRLFALVVGDVRVAEVLFNLKLSGDFVRAAGGTGSVDLVSLPSEEVRGMAGEMAANAVRKLIPPAQIVWLGHMKGAEALAYRPPNSGATERRLHEIWADCRLSVTSYFQEAYEMENLREFFLLKPFSVMGDEAERPAGEADAERVKKQKRAERDKKWEDLKTSSLPALHQALNDELKSSPYSAKELLATSPRRVADLWEELNLCSPAPESQLARQPGQSPPARASYAQLRDIVDVFGHLCRRAIAEDTRLTPRARQRLLDAVGKNREGYWQLDIRAFKIGAKPGPECSFSVPNDGLDTTASVKQTIAASRSNGWLVRMPRESDKQPALQMDGVTAASLLALHDLLILVDLDPDEAKILWQEMIGRRKLTWNLPTTKWRSAGRTTRVSWPTPRWCSIREYDFFIVHWHQVLDWFSYNPPLSPGGAAGATFLPEEKFERLVYAWIDFHYVTLQWQKPAGFTVDRRPRWPTLIKNIMELFGSERAREKAGRRHVSQYSILGWYRELALLFMPETLGTNARVRGQIDNYFPKDPLEVNKHFEDNPIEGGLKDLYDFWKEDESEIYDERCRKLALFAAKEMEELCKALCTAKLPACLEHLNVQPPYEKVKSLANDLKAERRALGSEA